MTSAALTFDSNALATVCEQWGIRRLSIFGSALGSSFGDDSDVDLLVEFHPGGHPGLFDFERLRDDLATVFGGRAVDLFTPASLGPHIRDQVLASAREAFAA